MKSLFFALLASLVWGTAPVLFKVGLRGEMPPMTALVFHNLSALVVAFAFVLVVDRRMDYPLRDIFFIALGGIMSGFLGLLLFFKAVKEGEVSVVAPVASTSPLWGSMLAFIFLGEPFSWLRALGILLVVCGIALIGFSSGK